MNSVFNLFHSEAYFEPFARQIANEALDRGETDVNEHVENVLFRSRACFYLTVTGNLLVCFCPSTIGVSIGLILVVVYASSLPWYIRTTMLMLRANQILSVE